MSTPSFEITPTTSKVLNNFGKIVEQMILSEGAVQKVRGPGKGGAVLATATLPEAWPKETAIYNYGRFLSTLSLFEKPRLTFISEDHVLISNDVKSSPFEVEFKLSDATTIDRVPVKALPIDNPAIRIEVKQGTFDNLLKASSLLELAVFNIIVDKGNVRLTASSDKNPNAHKFQFTVPDADVKRDLDGFTCKSQFTMSYFDLLSKGDYTVLIGEKWPYVYLQNNTLPVNYYIAEGVSGR